MSQLPLVDVPVVPVLTARQESAWTYLKTRTGGCTAEELGQYLHARRGKHAADQLCDWNGCHDEGMSVLKSVALKPLVIHRRTRGVWEPRAKADRTVDRGAQLSELPEWLT
jgi:hypothetical protein